mgnify:FL=1
MNAKMTSSAARLFVLCALFLSALMGFSSLGVAPQAQAAISNKCDGTAANDQNSLRVSPNHGAVFYIDSGQGQNLDATYVSYSVNNRAASTKTNLWVKVDTFTGGKVQLANTNDSAYPLGDVAASGTATSFFLLKATATTTSAQSHVVRVYSGKPGLTSSTELYSCSYTFTKVAETIKAAANKVTSIPAVTVGAVGTTMNVVVKGNTGTIGAGNASDGSVMWFSPSARSAWPTQSLRLEATSVQFYKNSARTQSAGSAFSNKLRITLSELQTAASAPNDKSFFYDATYTYRILGAASIAADLTPVAQIASGTQMKHTDVSSISSAGTTSISVSAPAINLAVTKSVASTATVSNGQTTFRYTISLANSGSSALSVDQVTDDPDNSLSYRAGTATFNSASILDPSWSADGTNLIFSGPFAVPANSTKTLVYDLYVGTCASGSYTYSNSATATVGSTIIGSGATTMSVTAASGTCGSTSVTATTTTTTLPIEVDTDVATVTGNTTATIYGLVDPNGDTGSTVFFDYGTSPTLASYTRTNVGTTNAQTTAYSVNKALTGLTSGTVYYYRVGAGSVLGSILSFVTTEPAANPTATTGSVSGMTLVSSKIDLTLSGTVDPNQITNGAKITFQYATDASSGSCSSLGTAVNVPSSGYLQDDVAADVVLAGAFATEVNTGSLVTGLTNNTYYCFKVRGWYNASSANWSTAVDGAWVSFLAKVRLTQTIDYPVPSTMVVNEVQSTTATATSSLAITYTSNTPDVCTVNASTGAVTGVSAGTCSITASQPGNNNYDPAADVTVFFTVNPLPPIITNTSLASGTIQSSYTETLTASQGNGTYSNWTLTAGSLPAGLTLNSSTGVISGTPTTAGTYSVTFTVDSGTQTSVTKTLSIVIDKLPQTITFATPSNSQISDGTKSVSATTDATGLHVTLTSNTTSVCTVAASPTTSPFTINLVGQGTCELVASQSGNSSYNAATNVTRQFLVTGPSYTLTFDPNSSFGSASTTGNAPSPVTSNVSWAAAGNTGSPALAKSGYTFAGWTENADGTGTSYAVGDLVSLSSNKTIYAKWNLITYTITYKNTSSTGGSVPSATVGVGGVTVASNSGSLVRTNYYLSGWTIGGTTYAFGDSYTLSADVDAEPIWSQYTLTYTDSLANSGTVPSATLGYGSVSLASNTGRLTRTGGWVFAGWTINGVDYDAGHSFTLTSNETATSRWVLGGFVLHYLDTDADSGAAPADDVAAAGVTIGDSGTLVRSGYYFVGWRIGSQTYSEGDSYTLTANTDATPVWGQYTLTYSAPTKDRGTAPGDLLYSGSITLDATGGTFERDGYYLSGWLIDSVAFDLGDPYSLTADKTATAIWSQYTISYVGTNSSSGAAPSAQNGAGSITLATNSGNLARNNFYLAGWTINGVNYGLGATYTLTGSVTASPRWAQYALTFLGAGATGGSTPANTNAVGNYTLPTNSGNLVRSGFSFAGWVIGSTTYQAGDTYNVTKNSNIFARWLRCSLTYEAPTKSSGSVPRSVTGCVTVSLAKNTGSLTRNGYFLAGWSIGGTTYNPGDSFTITTTTTASAVWQRYSITYLAAEATGGTVPANTFGSGNTVLAGNTGNLVRDNYYFAGWYLGSNPYATGATYDLKANIFAFANWQQYKVTYKTTGADGGTISADAITMGYRNLPVATYGTLYKNGYLFSGWNIGGTIYQPRSTIDLTGNVDAEPVWTQCQVTYNGQQANSGTVPSATLGCSNVIAGSGTLARRNFYFGGWAIDGVVYQPGETVTLAGHRTAYAVWKKYTMSFDGSSADSGSAPANVFHFGSMTIPRSAGSLAKAGYYVSGWRINGVDYRFGSSYTMNSDVVASPIWSQYTITYASISLYSGSLPTATSGFGTTELASLQGLAQAPTRTGFTFGGWVIGGVVYQPNDAYNLTGNVTAYVRWVRTR